MKKVRRESVGNSGRKSQICTENIKNKGYRMVPSNLKVLAKLGLCSNCSQKLDELVLACSCSQIFANARMLVFSLKFSAVLSVSKVCILKTKTDSGNNVSRGETCARHECFWKNISSFCWRLLKLTGLSSVPGGNPTRNILLVKAGFL